MKSIKSQPTIFFIFGATGDLSSRKLAPALYNLYLDGFMPEQFTIVGTGRTKLSDEDFQSKIHDGINDFSRTGKTKDAQWKEFSKNVVYQVSDAKDAETYKEFGAKIKEKREEWGQE